jgi:plastocyanin
VSDAVRTSERCLALLVAVIVPLLVLCPTAASGTTVTVMVTGNGYSFYFSPSSVSIQPGDTVRWTWNSSGHSTTSGSPGMPDGLWDSGILNQGAVFTYTFNTAGSFPYYCTVHGACCGMTGIVMVNGSPTPTPTPAPHAAFFVGEMPLGNGVYYLQLVNGNVFGYYSYLTDPRWIYHFDMGFEYWFDANDGHNGIYFYDFAANTFFYTSQGFPFPYLYDFGLNTVLYYYPDLNNPGHYTANPRYFYDFATHQIITR